MDILDKPLLTTEEVAAILGQAPGTVENWRYKEIGPPYVKMPNRAVRYRGPVIRDWINHLQAA